MKDGDRMKFQNRYTGEVMSWKEAYNEFKSWANHDDCGFWELFDEVDEIGVKAND